MATRYWVGGSGDWSGTTHWSATSGGAAGASEPTSADDVIVNASSGSPVITASGTANCASFVATGATGTLDATINVYGGTAVTIILVLPGTFAMATYNFGRVNFYNATAKTINVTGDTTKGKLDFSNSTGGISLVSNLACYSLTSSSGSTGIFNTGASTVSACYFSIGSGSTANFGTTTVSCYQEFVAETSSIITLNGTLNLLYNLAAGSVSGQIRIFTDGGHTYGTVNANVYPSTLATGSNLYITGTPTIGSLLLKSLTVAGDAEAFGAVAVIFGTVTVTSSAIVTGVDQYVNRLFVTSGAAGTQAEFVLTGTSTRLFANVDFADILVTYSSSVSGTSLGDCANNSGITFDAPRTLYQVGLIYNSSASWSTSSGGASGSAPPLAHDSIVFDSLSTSGEMVGPSLNLCKNVTDTALGVTVNLSKTASSASYARTSGSKFGVWGQIDGDARIFVVASASSNVLSLGARTDTTFKYNTAASTSYTVNLTIDTGAATVTLDGNCYIGILGAGTTLNGSLVVTSGILDLNDYPVRLRLLDVQSQTYCRSSTISFEKNNSSRLSVRGDPSLLDAEDATFNVSLWGLSLTFPDSGTVDNISLGTLNFYSASAGAQTVLFGKPFSATTLKRTIPYEGTLTLTVSSGKTVTFANLEIDGIQGTTQRCSTIVGATSSATGTIAISTPSVNTQFTHFRNANISGGTLNAYGPSDAGNNTGTINFVNNYSGAAFIGTGAATFTLPSDFNGQSMILVIGGGGSGGKGGGDSGPGGGGGGTTLDFDSIYLSPNETLYLTAGAGGAGATSVTIGNNGANSWVNYAGANSQPASLAQGVLANGGKGPTGSTTGAPYFYPFGGSGATVAGWGEYAIAGGSGGNSASLYSTGGGGGGAPGSIFNTTLTSYGGGGIYPPVATSSGGGGGGVRGAGASTTNVTPTTGGLGGANLSDVRAAGGTFSIAPEDGTDGGGGGGGGSATSAPTNIGGDGSTTSTYRYTSLDGSSSIGLTGIGSGSGGGASGNGAAGVPGIGGGSGGGGSLSPPSPGTAGGSGLVLILYGTYGPGRSYTTIVG